MMVSFQAINTFQSWGCVYVG